MSSFPNPDTYLNHLPPDAAEQFELARNLLIAVLGAAIWDILQYIPDDIGILRRSPIRIVLICFITTRFFATAFILLSIIGRTHFVEDCNGTWSRGAGISCTLAHLTASYIFLQRLWAVYTLNRWVKIVFFMLWLGANGLMTTSIYGAQFGHISGTGYCTYLKVHRYVSAAGFTLVFFDTAVFVATSYKIAISHNDFSTGINWDTIISGRALPRLSRAVLQGGQQYFLITICLSMPVAILIAIPIIPPTYQAMLPFPLTNLAASMACRVFRNLKLQPLPGFEMELPTISQDNPSSLDSNVQESSVSPSAAGPSNPKSPVVPVQCI